MSEPRNKHPIITFDAAGDHGNAVISPEAPYEGPHFTLIGCGPDEVQNELAERLCAIWNTRAEGPRPKPSTEETQKAAEVPAGDVRERVATIVVRAVNLALAGVKAPGRAVPEDGLYFADEILAALPRPKPSQEAVERLRDVGLTLGRSEPYTITPGSAFHADLRALLASFSDAPSDGGA